ncbi:response regulator [Puniceicoccaceae bacterium K14]|nr:response regulator [Puniceicoccaceae bacterium K14]
MPARTLGKILVIDDDHALRNLLEAVISVNGGDVLLAATPKEAIEHVSREKETISAVLLDMNLGSYKGEDVHDQIMEITTGIPIFPMSGCHEDEMEERFAHKKIAGFISKPFKAEDLISSLASAAQCKQSSQCV